MRVCINNIGIIKKAEFDLDGLTVITGLNNSGKSTIGKVLFSVFSSVENLVNNSFVDSRNYVLNMMSDLFEDSTFYARYSLRSKESKASLTNLQKFLDYYEYTFSKIKVATNKNNLINILKNFTTNLDEFDNEFFSLILVQSKNRRFIDTVETSKSYDFKSFIKKTLDKSVKLIDSDKDLIEYTNTRILRYLKSEFNEQILPLNNTYKTGKIEIYDKDIHFFDIEIVDDRINDRSFFLSPYKNTFFIDDIYALDKVQDYQEEFDRDFPYNRYIRIKDNLMITDFTKVKKHNDKLIEYIIRSDNNIYTEIENKMNVESILKEIELILPSKISFIEGKFVYSEQKLDIRNLATGSKIFAIIKLLLEKGLLDESTILILDEPESHLHPKWQNILAEIIVMLVEKLNLSILLTTHSPNFLLAIDVFSKKYKIREKTNFYQSVILDSAYTFSNINDNINEAYALMSRPFLELENELD